MRNPVAFTPQLPLSLLPPGNQLQLQQMEATVSAAEFWGFLARHAITNISQGIKVEGQECFLSPSWDGSDCLAQGLDYRARHQHVICARNTALYLRVRTARISGQKLGFCWLKNRATQRFPKPATWLYKFPTSFIFSVLTSTSSCCCSCFPPQNTYQHQSLPCARSSTGQRSRTSWGHGMSDGQKRFSEIQEYLVTVLGEGKETKMIITQ